MFLYTPPCTKVVIVKSETAWFVCPCP